MDLAQTHRRRCRCLPNSCRGGTVSRQQIHPPRTVRIKGSLSPTTAKLMVFHVGSVLVCLRFESRLIDGGVEFLSRVQ
jgi:hypothetical protein